MIFHFAEHDYKNLMNQTFMQLPKLWRGDYFILSLQMLYTKYLDAVKKIAGDDSFPIGIICDSIISSLKEYYKGYPADAFKAFGNVMETLMQSPLKIYQKSWDGELDGEDPLRLYRIRKVHTKHL